MVFNKNPSGTEYYPLPAYTKKNNGDETYAIKNGNEFYLSNKDGIETMAMKLNENGQLAPYFALDADGVPVCPILEENQTCLKMNISYYKKNSKDTKELYPKRWNKEYYIDDGRGMKYAKDEHNEPYYATSNDGNKYYAAKISSDGYLVQFPITDDAGNNIYIEENGAFVYPLNLTKNVPIYPIDEQGKEIYLKKNYIEYYGNNSQKLPIYAKESNKNDYFAQRDGKPYYSFYEERGLLYEYYPRLQNKDEFYLSDENKQLYAKFNLKERYARTRNFDDILAFKNGIPFYAIDEHNTEIYPMKEGQMFYRMDNLIEKIAFNKTNNTGFYAKNREGSEFYPKNFNVIAETKKEIVQDSFYREPTEEEISEHISSSI